MKIKNTNKYLKEHQANEGRLAFSVFDNFNAKYSLTFSFLFLFVFIFLFFIYPFSAKAASLIKPANTVGMVGWWRFDEGGGSSAADFSGQGNVGTLVAMEEEDWVAGHVGTALDFDDIGDEYVTIAHDSSLNPTTEISMVAWVKPRTFGGGVATIVDKEYLTSYLWYLNGAGSDMIINISGNDAESELSSITTGVWQHVAVTYDGSNVRFYVNAIAQGVSPMTGLIGTDTSDVRIGNDDTLVSPIDGYVDDVRIYSRTLSQTEIRQIMEGDRIARYSATSDASGSLADGLIAHWTMDGKDLNWGSGRVTDKSTQGNTGYVVNMSTTSSPIDGKIGQALSFDGVDDYIEPTSLITASGAFSSSFWFNTSNRLDYQIFLGGINANSQLGLVMNTSVLTVRDNVGGQTQFTLSPAPSLNKWNHLVVTRDDGNNLKAYLNGVDVTTGSPILSGDKYFRRIGSRSDGASPFLGSLDDVRIYNRALSSAEINKLYTGGKVTHDISFSGGSNLENGLIGWWTFDGKYTNWGNGRISDKSTQADSGYVVNMSTTSSPVSGKVGQALSFDGVNDYVINSTTVNTQRVSISAWIKLANYPGQKGHVVGFMNGIGSITHDKNLFIDTNGKPYFYVWDGTTKTTSAPVSALPLNKWVHLVAVADGTNAKVYVDGSEVSTVAAGNTYNVYSVPNIVIGGLTGNVSVAGGYMAQEVDDVRVYTRAISQDEILELYNLNR